MNWSGGFIGKRGRDIARQRMPHADDGERQR